MVILEDVGYIEVARRERPLSLLIVASLLLILDLVDLVFGLAPPELISGMDVLFEGFVSVAILLGALASLA